MLPPAIKALLDTHNGENAYIAVQLLIHQLHYTPEQALKAIPFIEISNSPVGQEFTWQLYVGALQLEYVVTEGYVPYMGADTTAARMVRVEKDGQYEPVPDLAGYLPLEEGKNSAEIQQILLEDYHQLLPQLWAWLDHPLEALL